MRLLACMTALCCLAYTLGYGVVAATSDEFLPANIERRLASETAAASRVIDDAGFYRVDSAACTDDLALMLDYRGTSCYWSMVPGWVSGHYTALELPTQRWAFRTEGMGADSYLDALASVGYCLRKDKAYPDMLPYGCEQIGRTELADGTGASIYRNGLALPLGYVFAEALPASAYDALNPVQKREALISCAVVEDECCKDIAASDGDFPFRKLEWELASCDGAVLEADSLCGKKDDMLTLRFVGEPDCETYLRIASPEVVYQDEDTDMMLMALTPAGTNRMYMIRQDGVFNYPQTGACMYLGHSEGEPEECVLKLGDSGMLRFDAIEILSVPTEYLRSSVAALQENGWKPQIERDRVHGAIELETEGVLQIALPYSSGWSARVDGQDAQLMHCGGMYMGIPLAAGGHEIELRYETPGLRIGAWISAAALAILLGLWMAGRLRRRRG